MANGSPAGADAAPRAPLKASAFPKLLSPPRAHPFPAPSGKSTSSTQCPANHFCSQLLSFLKAEGEDETRLLFLSPCSLPTPHLGLCNGGSKQAAAQREATTLLGEDEAWGTLSLPVASAEKPGPLDDVCFPSMTVPGPVFSRPGHQQPWGAVTTDGKWGVRDWMCRESCPVLPGLVKNSETL